MVPCDLSSGVDADTGQVTGGVIPADLTVTFGALKTRLIVGAGAGAGAQAAGRVELVDIGLKPHSPARTCHRRSGTRCSRCSRHRPGTTTYTPAAYWVWPPDPSGTLVPSCWCAQRR
ncbi:NAD(P)H-hydrate epimerase [uncultured Citricoccus sp.]|uniref:NAD(P)H-hydrate epimerase n=1 Tax=uncultured Citricoccus sp. TaxID=614031 RepID=UPI003419E9CA